MRLPEVFWDFGTPGALTATLPLSNILVIPQGRTAKTKHLHNSVVRAEIPITAPVLKNGRGK